MKFITKLNRQIIETQKMIDDTNKLLSKNHDDEMLLFMLKQDNALLKSIMQKRTKELLNYLKEPHCTIETILSDIFTTIPFEINPSVIAQAMGIKLIANSGIANNIAGKCYIDDEIIIEYKPASSNRDRFTISHELAHIIRHMPHRAANNTNFEDSSDVLYARNDFVDSSDPIEKEADKIAGNILMPKSNIEKILNSLEPLEQLSTKLMCDLFKISEGAVYHTLKNYNLLNNPKIKQEFSWSIQNH